MIAISKIIMDAYAHVVIMVPYGYDIHDMLQDIQHSMNDVILKNGKSVGELSSLGGDIRPQITTSNRKKVCYSNYATIRFVSYRNYDSIFRGVRYDAVALFSPSPKQITKIRQLIIPHQTALIIYD